MLKTIEVIIMDINTTIKKAYEETKEDHYDDTSKEVLVQETLAHIKEILEKEYLKHGEA